MAFTKRIGDSGVGMLTIGLFRRAKWGCDETQRSDKGTNVITYLDATLNVVS